MKRRVFVVMNSREAPGFPSLCLLDIELYGMKLLEVGCTTDVGPSVAPASRSARSHASSTQIQYDRPVFTDHLHVSTRDIILREICAYSDTASDHTSSCNFSISREKNVEKRPKLLPRPLRGELPCVGDDYCNGGRSSWGREGAPPAGEGHSYNPHRDPH